MTYIVDVSSSGQNAEVVLPAVSNTYYVIERIVYSYSGSITLGSGNLIITSGGTSILDFDIKNDILGNVLGSDSQGYQSANNEEVIIKLKGVTGLIAKLSIIYTEYSV